MQVVSSEEKCRTLFDQVRLTEGLQKAYDAYQQAVYRDGRNPFLSNKAPM